MVCTETTSAPPSGVHGLTVLRWLTIEKFSAESGYTPDAVRSKIKRGDWLEGEIWVKAPDGRILISTEAFEKWVTSHSLEYAQAASRQ
jgi:hypothetical protein